MSFEFPRTIEKSNIESIPLEVGGTEIVLQRHGKYERSVESENVGSLTPDGAKEISEMSRGFFKSLIESIPEEERKDLKILVVASDTQFRGGGRRSMETARKVIEAAKEQLGEFGMSEDQVINKAGMLKGEGGPRPTADLREPQMFDNSPEFVNFLKEKYGDMGKDFWVAFEDDAEKETREKMGAEGPDEITDRLKHVVAVLNRYSRMYHSKYPNKRLVIWAATHYDTISPFVKREIFEVGKEVPLAVDYGAGITIEVAPDGKAKTKIAGKEYELK